VNRAGLNNLKLGFIQIGIFLTYGFWILWNAEGEEATPSNRTYGTRVNPNENDDKERTKG
jgi:hypothetical protein